MECQRRLFEEHWICSRLYPWHISLWWFKKVVRRLGTIVSFIYHENFISLLFSDLAKFWEAFFGIDYVLALMSFDLTPTNMWFSCWNCSYTHRAKLVETEQYWRGWYKSLPSVCASFQWTPFSLFPWKQHEIWYYYLFSGMKVFQKSFCLVLHQNSCFWQGLTDWTGSSFELILTN